MANYSRIRAAASLAALALGLVADPAAAHEKGVLRLTDRRLTPGVTVGITGIQFGAGAALTLSLDGPAGRVALGSTRAGPTGAFADSLHVPANLAPGAYRLVARARDGDVVSSLAVEVLAGPTSDADAHTGHQMAGEPSPEPLALTRARHPAVTGAVLAGIAAFLLTGATLLRRAATVSHERN